MRDVLNSWLSQNRQLRVVCRLFRYSISWTKDSLNRAVTLTTASTSPAEKRCDGEERIEQAIRGGSQLPHSRGFR